MAGLCPSRQDIDQIWSWNQDVPATINSCVHELIAIRAAESPDAKAVQAWDGDFTYAELDTYSTRLAAHITGLGAAQCLAIPLLFEKSRWMPVAMLGVMKAACAAIALDANHPNARLRSILQQVNPSIIVSAPTMADRAGAIAGKSTNIIQLDETAAFLEESRYTLPTVRPSDLAYISFTSGTTGQPKGACISHANVRSAVHHQGAALGFTRDCQVLDFVPYSFDVAWSNVLHTLCAGGCLCIAREEDMLRDLAAVISSLAVTLINITPTMLRTIETIPASLQTVLLSGEMPYRENILKWASEVRLINCYGPTECTWKATFSPLQATAAERPDIGTGKGCCTWVVDANDAVKLVSIGEVGELYIEGPLVGQGYLFDDAATASAFIRDPPWLLVGGASSHGRTGRLYKTGDLVRQRPDGRLLFVGRKDTLQAKIRGQRVEIGDVEYHIRACLRDRLHVIAEVVPVNEESILILFIQTQGVEALQLEMILNELPEDLYTALPAFMHPSLYLPIGDLPIASTGKLDRRRLREETRKKSLAELRAMESTILPTDSFTRPLNETERILRSVWAELFQRDAESISATDDFLRAGGDSVAAIRMLGMARSKGLSLVYADVMRRKPLRLLAQTAQPSLASSEYESIAPFALLRNVGNLENLLQEASRKCSVQETHLQDMFPCTPLQEGMLACREANSYVYTQHFVLPASLHSDKLMRAWHVLVQRMPILRTTIINLANVGLVQVVLDQDAVKAFVDYDDPHELESPMGLATPLSRAAISDQYGARTFVLQLHHAVYDGWSRTIILDALASAYAGIEISSPPPFQNFVRYNMGVAESQETAAFWRNELEGCNAVPFPAARATSLIKEDLQHSINELSWPDTNITRSSVIFTAIALVMAVCTNSPDLLFGTTLSGRQAPVHGIEHMVGPTVATVPVRVSLDWQQTVDDTLSQLQEQILHITEHEQYGLSRIKKITASNGAEAKFNLLVIVQPSENRDRSGDDLFTKPFSSHGKTETPSGELGPFNSYGLMIVCHTSDLGLTLEMNFDSGSVGIDECQRLAQNFEQVLRQICKEDARGRKLRDLSLTSKQDLETACSWNDKPVASNEVPIMAVIGEQAVLRPDITAISAPDGSLTYSELQKRSSSLAQRLQTEGLTSGSLVVLYANKSAFMPVAMLAVLKAGCIAMPLSASTTSARAREIIASLQPRLILLPKEMAASSPFPDTVNSLHVSTPEWQTSMNSTPEGDLPHARMSDPAFVIFSSGSTGAPKAILWTHTTLSSNVSAAVESFGLGDRLCRCFQFAAYDFDVSTIETLATLATGGSLCIPSESDRLESLADAINKSQADWICLTPSVASAISPSTTPHLRTLVFAGEVLKPAIAKEWSASLDSVYNWYGPAEASLATIHQIRVDDDSHVSCIGRATSISKTWLIDCRDYNRLAPIGGVAELCLEGPSLSAGYIGRDSDVMNGRAFVSPAFLQQTSGPRRIVYRTGDLVKYQPDGSIVFLGRKEDAGRKLRGRWVDIASIEHHAYAFLATRLPSKVVVEIITTAGPESKELLVLFVCPEGSTHQNVDVARLVKDELPVDELEMFLASELPQFMVPGTYMALAELPITANGKVDRMRLRDICASRTSEKLASEQPRVGDSRKSATEIELCLQQLWSQIIGIDSHHLRANSHFLRLGGDSIAAMRLCSLARDKGLHLTTGAIFEHPKLEDMAAQVQRRPLIAHESVPQYSLLKTNLCTADARVHAAKICGLPEAQIEDILPCTPLQEGLLAMTARHPGQYISCSVLPLQEHVSESQLRIAWQVTVETLAILRTSIIDLPGQGLVQVVFRDWQFDDPCDLQSYLNGECKQIGLGTQLCRAAIINRNLVLALHHAIYDGASLRMMLAGLEDKYLSRPGLIVTPFNVFIKYLQSIMNEDTAAFWRDQLSKRDFNSFPVLPDESYQPIANDEISQVIEIDWPLDGITPASLIHAACSVLLARLSNSQAVIYGVVSSGRRADVAGIENCVGPTISTVPIAEVIDWHQTVEEYVRNVQQRSVATTRYEQYGLQNIRKVVDDPRRVEFQTLLVVNPVSDGHSLQTDGLLFKTRSFGSTLNTQGTDPFNTYALKIVCDIEKTGLNLHLSFDNAVLERVKVFEIAATFESLLRKLCSAEMTLETLRTMSIPDKQEPILLRGTVPSAGNSAVSLGGNMRSVHSSAPDYPLLEGCEDAWHVRRQAAQLCGVAESCIEDIYPCTALQEGLLALTMKRPDLM